MFTGIIEEIGRIKAISRQSRSIRLSVSCRKVLEDSRLGDSIAVNGICLTIADLVPGGFAADVMPETVRRTGLQQLKAGDPVNLERAMQLGGRLGGHLVSGHIDGTGIVSRRTAEDNAILLTITADPSLLRYVIQKGSVTLDGVSLTVANIERRSLQVSLIPHTAGQTILGALQPGDPVNIECDMVGKYVEKLLTARDNPSGSGEPAGLSLSFLEEHGFR